ncbi:MAG: cobalamin-dependent protein [Candidatus Hermodarchaeota archaeon]
MISTKDIILAHLRTNRGREIPVSEIVEKFNVKRTTISNAIKELQYKGQIEIERRPLKRGRYTVIWLSGDTISQPYVHEKEIVRKESSRSSKSVLKDQKFYTELSKQNFGDYINYLKSSDYNFTKFKEMINIHQQDLFGLVVSFIRPLMIEVGKRWAQNTLSTAEEHVISARIEKLIIKMIPKQKSDIRNTLLLVPVEGEQHTIGLLALELLLTELNYKIINLAPTLPVKSLISYIKELSTKPEWILLSITVGTYLGTLKREIKAIKEEFGENIRIAIGGQGISENERNYFPEAENVVISVEDLSNFLMKLSSG